MRRTKTLKRADSELHVFGPHDTPRNEKERIKAVGGTVGRKTDARIQHFSWTVGHEAGQFRAVQGFLAEIYYPRVSFPSQFVHRGKCRQPGSQRHPAQHAPFLKGLLTINRVKGGPERSEAITDTRFPMVPK